MAALLAAFSAVAFGVGDFFGGLSARRMAAVLTSITAQATGLLLILALTAVVSGDPSGADMWTGASAGLVGGLGLILFYWAMGRGPMSVIAPVSAVTSALVPIAAGVLGGERPGPVAAVGILLGLPAIMLISREPTRAEAQVSERVVERTTHIRLPQRLAAAGGLPVIAGGLSGVGFGAFFTLLSYTSKGSGLWPIVSARAAAMLLAAVVVLLVRPVRPGAAGPALGMVAGCLDAAGNSLYLLATRHGLLTVVGVVGAMYPASTVVLARIVLKERLALHQLAGLAVAAVAVGLIAAG